MERADKILRTALQRMKDPDAARTWLDASWMSLVGKPIAAHTRPASLRKGIIEIEADSKQWKSQVEAMNSLLCERINHAWGGSLVHRIRIELVTRRGRRIPYAEDNTHTPFVRTHSEDKSS
jgi:predicted nucleic acid-binding Zn ribbon protein